MVGDRALQGAHQVAQKSTRTGLSLLTSSLSQLAEVNSTTLALAIFVCLSFPTVLCQEGGPQPSSVFLTTNYSRPCAGPTTHRAVPEATGFARVYRMYLEGR